MALWSFGLHSSFCIRHLSLFYHDVGAVEMKEAVFEAADGLLVDVNLGAADLMAVLGGGLRAADPGELAPFLAAEISLAAAHVVEMQHIPRVADGLDVVLGLQELGEGLRIDQAGAEAMEDHGHDFKATQRGTG